MKIGVLFSGGKDSVFTTYYCLQQGWDVRCLITLKSKNQASYMFHVPNIDITKYQAKALEIPILYQETRGEKEKELQDLKRALQTAQKKYGIEGLAVGALASDYQHERVNRICHELNLKCFAPLWHKPQEKLLREMIDAGFEIILSAVAAEGFSEKWLGRKIDHDALKELKGLHEKYGVSIGGEGGEYESLVLNGPIFRKRLVIKAAEKKMDGERSGVYEIKKVILT